MRCQVQQVFTHDVLELPLLFLGAPFLFAEYEGGTDEHEEPDDAEATLNQAVVSGSSRDCPSPKSKRDDY